MSSLSAQILVSNIILQLKKPGLLGKTADSRTAVVNNKMTLEHLVMIESNKVLKKANSLNKKRGSGKESWEAAGK